MVPPTIRKSWSRNSPPTNEIPSCYNRLDINSDSNFRMFQPHSKTTGPIFFSECSGHDAKTPLGYSHA